MRFVFDADQTDFQRVLRDFLAAECTPAMVRALHTDETGRSRERWGRLGELGVLGLTAPESSGGLGLDEVALLLPLEEAGRAALPEPLVDSVAVGVPLLLDAGAGEPWVERVAAGEAMLAVGLEGSPFVADAHVADALLLVRDGTLHLVEPDAVALERRPSLDPSRRLFAVEWSRGTALTDDPDVLAAAFDRGAVATAAELLGITGRLIDMSVAYARERHQFGRPIGAFQAVKHLLADALVKSAFAAPVVYRAAVTIAESGPDRARDASMAKLRATEATLAAAGAALQIHGAIGYTAEHDLSLWLLRARALASAWGDAERHRARVADAVLGPA